MHISHDSVQSVYAYMTAGASVGVAKAIDTPLLEHVTDQAQDITIIIACGVIALRFVYDAVKLYRFIKNKGKPNE